MLDRDVVRRTLITARDGRILYIIQCSAQALSAVQIATLLMGRHARGCGVSDAIQRLKKLGFISFHMQPSNKTHGPRAIFFWSCTQRGSLWLDYHPEARTPHQPKTHAPRRKKVAEVAQTRAVTMCMVPPHAPAPLNLRKYAHRPLPLRVRKACRMPAHFWR